MPEALFARTETVIRLVESYTQRTLDAPGRMGAGSEAQFVSRQVRAQFPCVGDPNDLADDPAASPPTFDQTFFDRAVALTVAARIYGVLTSGVGGGVLLGERTADGSQETYAPPRADAAAEWVAEGMAALGRVSCVQAGFQSALSGFSLFGLAGRTRLIESQGVYPSLLAFGLGLLDTGAFPLLGYAGSDYFRNPTPFDIGGAI